MRRILTLFTVLMLSGALAFAQSQVVTGKVTDENGNPVARASVQEKSSKKGTITDANGDFTLNTRRGATLVISSVGYDNVEVTAGNSPITVSLRTGNQNLTEVVVTALGIKREKKALGYAVSTVDSKQLEQRAETDIARVLNGKTPGVDIGATSGLSGSGTNILIRGLSTISGDATPLFVVDGAPFDASTNAQSDFRYGNQTSSRFLDLDPNNIESVSILRGLSASVLYGEQGRNGVILITTKNGSTRRINKKTEITLVQSVFANEVANLPEYTDKYGGGTNQSTGFAFFSNWGAAFQNPPVTLTHPYSRTGTSALALDYQLSFPDLQGKQIAFQNNPNNVKDFFRTGLVTTTSINLAGSPGPNSTFSANYSRTDDKGFTRGNDLMKHSFGVGGNIKLTNNFTLSATANYVFTDYETPPNSVSFGSAATDGPGIFADVMYTPRSVDLTNWPFEDLNGGSVYYRSSNDIQNPYWTAKYVKFREKVNRIYGQASLKYDLLHNLSLLYRVGLDTYGDDNTLQSPKGGILLPLGAFQSVNERNTILTHNLIATYNTRFASHFDLTLTAGGDLNTTNYKQTGIYSTTQLVFNLFNHNNFVNHSNIGQGGGNLDFQSERESLGIFGEATAGFKDFLYATVGARNSWVSTLEPANRSIFYPSGSLSFIPTTAIESLKGNKWINYAKLRVGYATSARFPDPYRTRAALNIGSNVFNDRTGNQINTNSIPNRLPNPDLKPELLGELEAGLEAKLIKNRVNLDFTWYDRKSTNQIVSQQLDPSSGFNEKEINVGAVQNKGVEIGLGITPLKTKNFSWDFTINFTRNRNKVTQLLEGTDQIVVSGYTNLGGFAKVGYPLGIMEGSYTQRDPKTGLRIVDANGYYLGSTDIGIIGDPNPDFKSSLINNFYYRGLNFHMQWDYTKGGDIYSTTIRTLFARGVTKDTDFDRLQPLILPGVKQDGTPNDIQETAFEAYFNSVGFGPSGESVYDATLIRLREVSLSYSIPAKLLSKTPFGSLSLTLAGYNLWYNAPNTPKYMHFDPETSGLGASSYRGFEFITGPSSRRFGGSIRVTF